MVLSLRRQTRMGRLIWLRDIAQIMRLPTKWNWIEAQARELGIVRSLA